MTAGRAPMPAPLRDRLLDLAETRPWPLSRYARSRDRARARRRRLHQLLLAVGGEPADLDWCVPPDVLHAVEAVVEVHPDFNLWLGDEAWRCPTVRGAVRAAYGPPGWGAALHDAVRSALLLSGIPAAQAVILAELPRLWTPLADDCPPLGDGWG